MLCHQECYQFVPRLFSPKQPGYEVDVMRQWYMFRGGWQWYNFYLRYIVSLEIKPFSSLIFDHYSEENEENTLWMNNEENTLSADNAHIFSTICVSADMLQSCLFVNLIDTSFMYIIACLIMVQLYSTRHPDLAAKPHIVFGIFAAIILVAVSGVVRLINLTYLVSSARTQVSMLYSFVYSLHFEVKVIAIFFKINTVAIT